MTGSRGAKSAEEIQGFEYDWLASDEGGYVALFSTAGRGYAPAEFLRDTDAHDAAIDEILASPETTSARFAPKVGPGLKNIWKLVAERGLYAFDGDAVGGPYRLVAAPENPIRAASLPKLAAEVAAQLRIGVRFGSQTVLVPKQLERNG